MNQSLGWYYTGFTVLISCKNVQCNTSIAHWQSLIPTQELVGLILQEPDTLTAKTFLEIGCGSAKLLKTTSSHSTKIILGDLSEKMLELRKSQLDDSEIKAPFNGIITKRERDPGDIVIPGTAILSLISTKVLWIKAWEISCMGCW